MLNLYSLAPWPKKRPNPPSAALPAVTIVIEWENAIDVEDKWTRPQWPRSSAKSRTLRPG